jgi:16S rRNA G966 N2-methylase RsmD
MKVDSEFASLIPPLSHDERKQLEASVVAEGCREALIVWAEESILLDGHNRYGICRTHDIKFKTSEKSFPDRDAAKRWMLENQLGRRNLAPEAIAYLRGKLYREERKASGAPEGNSNAAKQGTQSEHLKTAERLAEKLKVGRATITRDAKFSEQLDKLAADLGDEFRQEVLSRDTKLTRRDVNALADATPEEARTVLPNVVKKKTSAKDEIRRLRSSAKAKELSAEQDSGGKVKVCRIENLELPEDSIDMIFTDPPYHDEHMDLIYELAKLAAKCLKPGSLCLVYAGKMYLPDIIAHLSMELEYVWQFIVFHPFSQARSNSRAVFENYRPILVFRKPGPVPHASKQPWVQDVVRGRREKGQHPWQQDEDAPRQYIEAYTEPGATVLDPFTGGGTTAAVCKALGRRFLAFDAEESAVNLTLARLSAVKEEAA